MADMGQIVKKSMARSCCAESGREAATSAGESSSLATACGALPGRRAGKLVPRSNGDQKHRAAARRVRYSFVINCIRQNLLIGANTLVRIAGPRADRQQV